MLDIEPWVKNHFSFRILKASLHFFWYPVCYGTIEKSESILISVLLFGFFSLWKLRVVSWLLRCCCCVTSVVSDSVWPHRWQPTRIPCPWDSPGKNTGVGCHFLLQCMKVKVKVKSLSRVRLLSTPWTAAYQAPPPMGFSSQEYWSGVPLPSPQVVSTVVYTQASYSVRINQT